MSSNGFCYGQGGRISKPTTKRINISGSFSALYDSTSFRDAFLADTPLPVLFNLTGDQALSTGNTGYQFVLPHTRLEGELPNSNEGDEIVVAHSFRGSTTPPPSHCGSWPAPLTPHSDAHLHCGRRGVPSPRRRSEAGC